MVTCVGLGWLICAPAGLGAAGHPLTAALKIRDLGGRASLLSRLGWAERGDEKAEKG